MAARGNQFRICNRWESNDRTGDDIRAIFTRARTTGELIYWRRVPQNWSWLACSILCGSLKNDVLKAADSGSGGTVLLKRHLSSVAGEEILAPRPSLQHAAGDRWQPALQARQSPLPAKLSLWHRFSRNRFPLQTIERFVCTNARGRRLTSYRKVYSSRAQSTGRRIDRRPHLRITISLAPLHGLPSSEPFEIDFPNVGVSSQDRDRLPASDTRCFASAKRRPVHATSLFPANARRS